MKEIWFDKRTGDKLIGDAAIAQRLEESGPGDLVSIQDVALSPDITPDTKRVKRLNDREWDKDDYLTYGKHIISVLADDPRFDRLKRVHIDRLSTFGYGRSRFGIKLMFGNNFSDYLAELGEPSPDQDPYEHWSRKQFAAYALEQAERLKHRPTGDDYTAAHHDGYGPSPWHMAKHAGHPNEVNELIGYPSIYYWEEEDFIAWGARVMHVNNGMPLTRRMLAILSGRERGPGFSTARDHFGTLSRLQELATERYTTDPLSVQKREQIARSRLNNLASKNLVNGWVVKHLNGMSIASFIAKIDISYDLLPTTDEQEYQYIGLAGTDEYVADLIQRRPDLDLEEIQLSAIATHHIDDIWQLSRRWDRHLKVTTDDLGYTRKGNLDRYTSPGTGGQNALAAHAIAHSL